MAARAMRLGEVFARAERLQTLGLTPPPAARICRRPEKKWLACAGWHCRFAGAGRCPGWISWGRAMSNFEFMQRMTFGQYLPTGSFLHRLDARARIIIFTAFLVAVTVVQSLPGLRYSACCLHVLL